MEITHKAAYTYTYKINKKSINPWQRRNQDYESNNINRDNRSE